MRNLGRKDTPVYPLLPKCEECGHRVSENPAYTGIRHWPWCSKATREQMRLWQNRDKLRELRTARRIGE